MPKNSEDGALPESTLTFKCLSHTKRDDGLIGRYNLEVTDSRNEKVVTISIEPKHLASARSMKRILLDRCMFYRATRASHGEMLLELFDQNPEEIQESSHPAGDFLVCTNPQ
jgi:hypothetical protein